MFKYLLLISALSFTLPVFAQEAESAGTATFTGSITLWIAIIIGFIASFLTLSYAVQMKGSTVGTILSLFGIGMFLVVVGFLAVVVAWAPAPVQKLVHDLVFIIGYVLMLVGATRIRRLSV